MTLLNVSNVSLVLVKLSTRSLGLGHPRVDDAIHDVETSIKDARTREAQIEKDLSHYQDRHRSAKNELVKLMSNTTAELSVLPGMEAYAGPRSLRLIYSDLEAELRKYHKMNYMVVMECVDELRYS